jgi:hypothetical protein
MAVDGAIIWNIILTLVIVPYAWAFKNLYAEVNRLQILLNKTREEYASKEDLRDTSNRIMEALHRLEDKLDKVLSR